MGNNYTNFPQNRPVHSFSEPPAGSSGGQDAAQLLGPTQKALEELEMGVLVAQGSGGIANIGPGSTSFLGATVLSIPAGDYEHRKFIAEDAVAYVRRGTFMVKIDPANPPTVGGALRVSFASGKKGWLTSSATSSLAIDPGAGIKVEMVYNNVARVYFAGLPEYAIAGS